MGALVVAYGLTGDWEKIGLVDTENGSGELYEGHQVPGTTLVIGEYLYARIEPPFTIPKYMEAHAALIEAGCDVVILDSISHAWAGAGGLLDKQHNLAKGQNSYTAWRDVTPDHNAFVDMMLQSPAHIIATMRAKVEYVVEQNDRGKAAPKKIGLAPVQREGLDFEFTVVMDIDQQSHLASASKDRTSLFDGENFKLSVDTGKKMLAWLNKGAEAPPPPNPDDELVARIKAALAKAPDSAAVERIVSHKDAQRLRLQIAMDVDLARARVAIASISTPDNTDWTTGSEEAA